MPLIIKTRFAEMLYTVKPTTEPSTIERGFFDASTTLPKASRVLVGCPARITYTTHPLDWDRT